MYLLELIAAFFASFFFGVLFSIPRKCLISAGAVGMFGWLIYMGMRNFNTVLAIFLAAIIIGLLSEALARIFKTPVTIFSIPGIIPLVPGAGAYYTMLAFIDGDFNLGMAKGAETLLSAGSIAAGIAVTGATFRIYKERFR